MAARLRRALAGLLVLGLGAGAYLALDRGSEPSDAAAMAPAAREAGPVELASFEVETVAERDFARTVSVSGPARPVRRAVVTAEVSGRLSEVAVEVGEPVQAGAVLARFDETLLRSALAAREATLEARRSEIQLAEWTLERRQQLGNRGITSDADLLSARSQLLNLQAQARALEAEVADARKTLEDAVVTAPFDGVVAARAVEPGQTVGVNTELLQLVDLSTVEVAASVPTSRIGDIAVGQAARLRFDGAGTRVFEGRVSRIAPEAEAGSRAIAVYVTLPNPDGAIRGGMFAVGEIAVEAMEKVVALPPAAIRRDDAGAFVLAARDGRLARRDVETGALLPREGLVVVRSGVSAGDTVVVAPLPDLKAETEVTIQSADGNSREGPNPT
ncbi:efflux RND transporter periplasmic adaptor subunit [Aureimonas flava]|uniref:Efflux RND transporter periplasmic adaptor subunit n=1 Tax=Aureimonas flava TaxID=2320271 RepID=A0A3A1WPR0_9HYPH|nr:efflux RND transporter periplasmic adaptor subunit [Aureimonas flava]RIY01982.1 efflux RND transporter periplasmic adaptor subunit [Aureimonas flava]